jgi:hypothetical protein
MNSSDDTYEISNALNAASANVGAREVLRALANLSEHDLDTNFVITIVSNAGVHHLPEECQRGEMFIASQGSLDFSTSESIHDEFERILRRVARKLKSKEWRRVYVVPFGPTPLSMQIKLLVYRICGIESIEVMHIPGGPRVDIQFDLRRLIVESDSSESVDDRLDSTIGKCNDS